MPRAQTHIITADTRMLFRLAVTGRPVHTCRTASYARGRILRGQRGVGEGSGARSRAVVSACLSAMPSTSTKMAGPGGLTPQPAAPATCYAERESRLWHLAASTSAGPQERWSARGISTAALRWRGTPPMCHRAGAAGSARRADWPDPCGQSRTDSPPIAFTWCLTPGRRTLLSPAPIAGHTFSPAQQFSVV